MELNNILNKQKVSESSPDRKYGDDLVDYIMKSETELARLCKVFDTDKPKLASNASSVTPQELLTFVSQIGNNPINISVECPEFYGDEKDRLEFKNWLTQFESVINTRRNWTEEFKITYLKSKVLKNAAPFIAHLGPAEGNYELCIEALKEQYLDEDFIVDEYFRLICSESPEYDESYTKTRVYIANVRNHLHNLKTHYNIDLVDKDSGGHKFLSHIILSNTCFSLNLGPLRFGYISCDY